MDLACRNNPDISAAAERVAAAQGTLDEAYSYYWPVLQVMERYTMTDQPSRAFANILDQGRFNDTMDFNNPGVVSNFRTGLTGSITLYDGGRRRARVSAATAVKESLAAIRESVRRDIAYEVARAWFLIFKAREAAAAQEKSIDTLSAHLRIAEARQSEGAIRRSDVLAVQVRLAETRETAIVARNSSIRAESALRLVMGLGTADTLELIPPTPSDIPARPPLEPLVQRARQQRPEILRAQKEVEAAAAKVREAHAGYYPEVTIFGDLGFDSKRPTLDRSSWLWGVSFMESIFDAFRTPARVAQAMANLKGAHATGRKTVLQIEMDVKNSLLDAEEADARTEVASQAVGLAKESLRLVEAEYQEGTADITRLLESELSLTRARTRLSASDYDRTLSRIAMAHATGDYPAAPATAVAGRPEQENQK